MENFLPGKAKEMNFDYETLSKINPRLMYAARAWRVLVSVLAVTYILRRYASITGFGPDGPYAKRPGYDVIVAAIGTCKRLDTPLDALCVAPFQFLNELVQFLFRFVWS